MIELPVSWILNHDTTSFTEGLVYHRDWLLESVGLQASSEVLLLERKTGSVVSRREVPNDVFAEGLALFGGALFLFTWRNGLVLRFSATDSVSMKHDVLKLQGEAWGATVSTDGLLVVSDGSSRLRFVDPKDMHLVRSLGVHVDGVELDSLNELERVGQEIWANVLPTNLIVRIDPESGLVKGVFLIRPPYGLGGAFKPLNGIAFDSATHELALVGKNWPKIGLVNRDALCNARLFATC